MSRHERRWTIAVDFDGVLHSYTTHEYPFNAAKVLDPPVPGMLPWLISLVVDSRFKVCISSARNTAPGGIEAMVNWLIENGVPVEIVEQIDFPEIKPRAHVMIDDHAIQFTGRPIPLDQLAEFKPWNRP